MKCPKCGEERIFYARLEVVVRRTVLLDGAGEPCPDGSERDTEEEQDYCYAPELDGVQCGALACGHKGSPHDFIEDVDTLFRVGLMEFAEQEPK